MADAATGSQARLLRDHGRQQFVGMQAALHQELGLALANQLDGLGGRGVAVGHVDDLASPPRSIPLPWRISRILAAGPTRIGVISPFAPASMAPASAVSSQGCTTAVATGSRLRHLRQQLLVLSRSGFVSHRVLPP